MTTYESPAITSVILAEKPHRPVRNTIPEPEPYTILVYKEQPRHLYPEDIKKFHKQQLADTFSFKRKGFRKFQK